MNKRASLLDVFQIVISLFIISIVVLSIGTFWTKMREPLLTGFDSSALTFYDSTERAILNFDNVYLIIAVGLIIATTILAFFIDTHPVYFILSLIILMFAIAVSVPLSNTVSAFINNTGSGNSEFNQTAANYPKMLWISTNLQLIAAIAGISIGLALFIKFSARGDR